MKQALKLGFTLALYAAVSCFALAIVNNFTAPVIEQHAKEKEAAALKMIFPDADDFAAITDFEKPASSTSIESFYKVMKGGNVLGYAAKCSGPTYDTTTLIAGFAPDMTVSGVHILSTTDSPGFGQKAADPGYSNSKGKTFYGQFAGLNASSPLSLGSDFEAISGATITSRSIGAIINDAALTVSNYIRKGGAK